MARQTVRVHPDSSSERLLFLKDALGEAPVERVRLADLTASFTPRSGGVDGEWALALANLEGELPPIVVHRPTLSVIDGLHRLRAARLRGRTHIAARFFDGSRQDAALLAVAMNVTQGRPLSQSERVAAAERIVAARPQWSDRAIAVVAGLSAKKVSELRARAQGLPRCERRVGLDGRARPLSTVQGRELAGELLRADPKASLRTIARRAGISPATVADVRDRLLRGEDPVPPRQRGLAAGRGAREGREAGGRDREETRSAEELVILFEALRRDPSLRLNEVGRSMLRMLDACALLARDRGRIIAHLPPHCADQLAELMRGYSQMCQAFADELGTGADRPGPAR
ncbi:ParB N-terminal domain-containing protein [Streptomyces sp. Tu 3180]|uniref:ParB N-terminal domain-containing protein n=1 Tax=Streptomyces sp. Tu 3180 TaxID=2682611 RepID=UPI00135AE6E0|nr:ParB N-terminal domain-containing protein [Streptomyces sp. Tu 3180]KAF3469393.1 ParB N-terminal domain-containing protein [Streptomyces sp. Tu 3180]